jgi:hypothetical protein
MCSSFKTEILSGGHNFNTTNRALTLNTQDTFKLALYTSASTMDATTTAYGVPTNEASGTGYSAGGDALTIAQVPTLSGSTATIDFTDLVFSTVTITARGALIYNSSVSNTAVAVLDFGSDKSASAGDFTIQFPAVGATTSIIRIA